MWSRLAKMNIKPTIIQSKNAEDKKKCKKKKSIMVVLNN